MKYFLLHMKRNMDSIHTPINVKKFKVHLLKYLRGRQSQLQFSKRLGFGFNQYAKWEKQEKRFNWNDFLNLSKHKKIDVSKILSRLYDIPLNSLAPEGLTSSHIISRLKDYYFRDAIELSSFLKIHPSRLNRYLLGTHDAQFETVIKLLLMRPHIFLKFLSEIKCLDAFPLLKKEKLFLEKTMHEDMLFPYASSVQHFIATKTYQTLPEHRSDILAQHLNLSELQVNFAIAESVRNNIIHFDGKKYKLDISCIEFKGMDRQQVVDVLSYWSYRGICAAQESVRTGHMGSGRAGFRIFSISQKGAEAMQEKISQTYFELLKIINEDSGPPEVVRTFILQYFSPEESPPIAISTTDDMQLQVSRSGQRK